LPTPLMPTPFDIRATDEELADLDQRLAATRWPSPSEPGWSLGTDPEWLRELVEYWRGDFDWRASEAWMRETLPGQRVHLRGIDLHFSHIPGRGPNPQPLLLLHGWPSSHVEMRKLVGPLSDPAAYGGSAEDAFEVVVGSLPGHGFSSAPIDPRFGADEAADCFRDLMVDVLGFDRFGVHGGDRGAFVATGLAHRHPAHITGIHQSLPMGIPENPPTREEQAWLSETARWSAEEGGYSAIQGTRPLSLAYGLNDSPVGLAGWICEKFRAWSDCDGDPLNAFTRDELLDNVMIYWLSGCIYPSTRFYWAHRQAPPAAIRPVRIDVPTAMTVFPREVMHPPRSAVARKYDLRQWNEPERGGHFAPLEAPEVLIDDLRRFYRGLREGGRGPRAKI
jgi:pimeloyl-ACP methyl ester carboxylesterase